MSEKITREEFRFVAKDESDNEHVLVVYREYIIVNSSGGRQEVPGQFSIETLDGYPVNVVSKGKYKTVIGGIDLTSDDPRAPP